MTSSPEEQALEALREAARKIENEAGEAVTKHADEQIRLAFQVPPLMSNFGVTYPQCSNGPDCQCPFHWSIRAEAAMASHNWRTGSACPVCGLMITHGDRKHQFTVYPDRTVLEPGPDFDQGIYRLLADAEETRLRQRRREIAEQQTRHGFPMAEITDTTSGWQAGTCTGCGMTDAVKGPAGAELCKWCDELRILAPLPVTVIKPPEPEPARQGISLKDWATTAMLGVAAVLAVFGLVEASGAIMVIVLLYRLARWLAAAHAAVGASATAPARGTSASPWSRCQPGITSRTAPRHAAAGGPGRS